jgi:hypothetical protein
MAGRTWRAPVIFTAAVTAVPLPVLALHGVQLGVRPSFVPAMLAVVAGFDVLSAYPLVQQFRDEGDARALAMSAPASGRSSS